MFSQPLQQIYAVAVGQAQVGQYQVHRLGFDMLLGTGYTACRTDLESFFAKPCFQYHAVSDIIFYD